MTLNTLEAAVATLAFLGPGALFYFTVSMFFPQRLERQQTIILRSLAFSVINYAIWFWVIYLIVTHSLFSEHVILTVVAWVVIIFLSPILLGLLLVYLNEQDVVGRVFRRVGLNPIHPVPTSWDYKFRNTRGDRWVSVRMVDGSEAAGYFGSNSFASNGTAERDLYLEDVYRVADDGQWQRVPGSDGVLIPGEHIMHIEFWNQDQEGYGEDEQAQ